MNTKLNSKDLNKVDGGSGMAAGIEAGLNGAKTGLNSGKEHDLIPVQKLKNEVLANLSGGVRYSPYRKKANEIVQEKGFKGLLETLF